MFPQPIKGVSPILSGVLIVVVAVVVGFFYSFFTTDLLSGIVGDATKNNFHGYSATQCREFKPEIVSFRLISNLSYTDILRISRSQGEEDMFHGGAVAKIGEVVLTAWEYNNTSWYSVYTHDGIVVKQPTPLTSNALLPSVGVLGNNFVVSDWYFNGTNYELNISIIDTEGNIVINKQISFSEENEMLPSLSYNGTHLGIAYVYGRNGSWDVKFMLLNANLDVIDDVNISSQDAVEYNPDVSALKDIFYVVYETYAYGNSTIKMSSYSKGVINHYGNVTTNIYAQALPSIATSPERVVVVYEEQGNIKLTAYDIDLNKVVDNKPLYPISNSQMMPSITYGNGKFMVVWVEKTPSSGLVRGVRITSDLNISDVFTITEPPQSVSTSISFGGGVFSILNLGKLNSEWDIYAKFISDKVFVMLLKNPSSLNITITDFKIIFDDSSYCFLKGDDAYLLPSSVERFFGYGCDIEKTCQDIKLIHLGTECGVRTFEPPC